MWEDRSMAWEALQHWSVGTCSAELVPPAVCEAAEVSPRPCLPNFRLQRGKCCREYRSIAIPATWTSGCAALPPIRRSFGESQRPLAAKRSPALDLSRLQLHPRYKNVAYRGLKTIPPFLYRMLPAESC